jgi:hypothetical protein
MLQKLEIYFWKEFNEKYYIFSAKYSLNIHKRDLELKYR